MTGVAGLLSLNLSTVMATVESNNSITVFLDADVPSLTAVKIGEEIRQIDNVATCTFRQKDDALADIIHSMSGDQGSSSSGEDSGDLFYGLQGSDNPLPDSYVISMDDLSQYSATAAQIEAIDGVDYVNNYQEVASMLSNMERLVRICSIGILALLAIVSLFIIANTVKVTLFSRRMEINIHEVGGRHQQLCAAALYRGGRGHRRHLRRDFRHGAVLRLRQGGGSGLRHCALPHLCEYPPLCGMAVPGVYRRWHVLWHSGRRHLHRPVPEAGGRGRHCVTRTFL